MESEDSQPQTTDTATVQTTKAAEPTLLASWDFTGKNGTTNSAIADSTGKYNLTLKDGAKIEQYGDRSNNEALSLRGDGQYAQIDDQLFKDAGDSFTLEFASKTRHDDSGKFFSFIVGRLERRQHHRSGQRQQVPDVLQQQDRHQGRYLQQQLG